MTPLPVAVIDDSALCREQLRRIIEADQDLRVVVDLYDGSDIVDQLRWSGATVLVTDLLMPNIDGWDVVRAVMRDYPVPIIVVSSGGFTDVSAFEATRLGALEVAAKPEFGDTKAGSALRAAIRRVATVPVIRHPGTPSVANRSSHPGPSVANGPARSAPVRQSHEAMIEVAGIVASAGGPPALVGLLGAIPVEDAPAILVAQHMPPGYAPSFARFLASRCPFEVHVATGPIPLEAGHVVIPDSGADLVVMSPQRARSRPTEAGLCPNADVLLGSLAEQLGPRAAGVVLSGIGSDGALGLAALRAAGGLTVAQDEASAAVFGMPKAAAEAAQFQLSPAEIGRLLARARRRRSGAP